MINLIFKEYCLYVVVCLKDNKIQIQHYYTKQPTIVNFFILISIKHFIWHTHHFLHFYKIIKYNTDIYIKINSAQNNI